jgi:pimeloyl-ACP methyl ester carboxylesterase
VSFRTSDGVTIVGTLHPAAEPAAPAVVLVHQLSSDRAEWAPVVAELTGITALAIDLRGHGESTAGPDGPIAFASFSAEDWAALPLDVDAGLGFLRAHPALRPERIAVAGSSIGSSAAIVAAGRDPDVAAVVAISPGRAYHGIDALTPVPELGGRPLFAIAAEHELPAAEAAETMARLAPAGRVEIVTGSSAHGLALVAEEPALAGRIAAFLREGLGSE